MPSPCPVHRSRGCAVRRAEPGLGVAVPEQTLLTAPIPQPPLPAHRRMSRSAPPRHHRSHPKSRSPASRHPGYLLFTVRNMDLLMSVPTPLLAWQR